MNFFDLPGMVQLAYGLLAAVAGIACVIQGLRNVRFMFRMIVWFIMGAVSVGIITSIPVLGARFGSNVRTNVPSTVQPGDVQAPFDVPLP